MQLNLRFSPLTTGLAFLPMTGILVATSVTAQTRVLPRTGAKPLVMTGMALGAIAMILFTRLTPGGSYASARPSRTAHRRSWGWGASSRPRSAPRRSASSRTRPALPRRWSTPPSRSAAPSASPLLSTAIGERRRRLRRDPQPPARMVAAAAASMATRRRSWWAAGIFAAGLLLALLILPSKTRAAHACTPQDSARSRNRLRPPPRMSRWRAGRAGQAGGPSGRLVSGPDDPLAAPVT